MDATSYYELEVWPRMLFYLVSGFKGWEHGTCCGALAAVWAHSVCRADVCGLAHRLRAFAVIPCVLLLCVSPLKPLLGHAGRGIQEEGRHTDTGAVAGGSLLLILLSSWYPLRLGISAASRCSASLARMLWPAATLPAANRRWDTNSQSLHPCR